MGHPSWPDGGRGLVLTAVHGWVGARGREWLPRGHARGAATRCSPWRGCPRMPAIAGQLAALELEDALTGLLRGEIAARSDPGCAPGRDAIAAIDAG